MRDKDIEDFKHIAEEATKAMIRIADEMESERPELDMSSFVTGPPKKEDVEVAEASRAYERQEQRMSDALDENPEDYILGGPLSMTPKTVARVLRKFGEWFDDPNKSPGFAVHLNEGLDHKYAPGYLLRRVGAILEQKLREEEE